MCQLEKMSPCAPPQSVVAASPQRGEADHAASPSWRVVDDAQSFTRQGVGNLPIIMTRNSGLLAVEIYTDLNHVPHPRPL
jgi:hypothetical protein